jgi:hypothetical protein
VNAVSYSLEAVFVIDDEIDAGGVRREHPDLTSAARE